MIVYRLKEIADSKKIIKSDVHYLSGVSYPTVLRIWNNTNIKQIDTTVLDKLCEVLNCEPCDLIERIPDDAQLAIN